MDPNELIERVLQAAVVLGGIATASLVLLALAVAIALGIGGKPWLRAVAWGTRQNFLAARNSGRFLFWAALVRIPNAIRREFEAGAEHYAREIHCQSCGGEEPSFRDHVCTRCRYRTRRNVSAPCPCCRRKERSVTCSGCEKDVVLVRLGKTSPVGGRVGR